LFWVYALGGGLVSVWNVAHNVGGGLIGPLFLLGLWAFNDDWRAAFYVPAMFALFIAVFVFLTMRDTPQSCGLPAIEEYKDDYPENYTKSFETELSAKKIFFKYILKHKLLWYIAIANVFVYMIRCGVHRFI
jgi:OPA family glycerol-3-phosphate transporter-like MFS transporter